MFGKVLMYIRSRLSRHFIEWSRHFVVWPDQSVQLPRYKTDVDEPWDASRRHLIMEGDQAKCFRMGTHVVKVVHTNLCPTCAHRMFLMRSKDRRIWRITGRAQASLYIMVPDQWLVRTLGWSRQKWWTEGNGQNKRRGPLYGSGQVVPRACQWKI